MSSARTQCEEVRELVGAFVDGELERSSASAVEEHLIGCRSCALLRDDLVRLRQAVAELELPEPEPVRMWANIEHRLAEQEPTAVGAWLGSGPGGWNRQLVLAAATFAVAFGLGVAYPYVSARLRQPAPATLNQPPLTLTVGDYVQQVSGGSPDAFWIRYGAIDTQPGALADKLDFRPNVPDRLPGGFRVTSAKLLKDACCYTVQLRYESPSGVLDVFECHDDHPVSFGDVEARRAELSGLAYTSLRWAGTNLTAQIFNDDNVNIIVVGELEPDLADRVVQGFRDASD